MKNSKHPNYIRQRLGVHWKQDWSYNPATGVYSSRSATMEIKIKPVFEELTFGNFRVFDNTSTKYVAVLSSFKADQIKIFNESGTWDTPEQALRDVLVVPTSENIH